MEDSVPDNRMRMAAFERVRALCESHGHLIAHQIGEGFYVDGQRYPLGQSAARNLKPAQMRFLLSINTVFPKTGNRVSYDDQHEVHRQIFDGDQMVDYAFMGENPDAPDNRWLKEAFENQVPIIYFLGIAPGRYKAILPAFSGGWDRPSRRAQISFGTSEQSSLTPPATDTERRYALSVCPGTI
jgi:putative restriction endonuclease